MQLEANSGLILAKTACPGKIRFPSYGPKYAKFGHYGISVPFFKCEYHGNEKSKSKSVWIFIKVKDDTSSENAPKFDKQYQSQKKIDI